MTADDDTIAAIATAAGSAGVGIVRLSGAAAPAIARTLCGRRLRARHAHHVRFRDAAGETIDDGIALQFAAPASFTGEDVVELQAHGSPALLQALLARCVALGARIARPGEFSERAFLNGRLDLLQAEAIADLVAASDLAAAGAARRSLDGEFSRRVDALAQQLVALRVQVEAAIDFADEPLETLGGERLHADLATAVGALAALLAAAERGRRLRDGLHVVIAGPPNAGKSSLLNVLSGSERAIVTDIAGTTRDLLQETVRVDGVELTLVDTAGLREAGDAIEREGMRRALDEIGRADLVLLVTDARSADGLDPALAAAISRASRVLHVRNKADLPGRIGTPAGADARSPDTVLVSARSGEGLGALRSRLAAAAAGDGLDGAFSARQRHVDALRRAGTELDASAAWLHAGMPELAAEALRVAHRDLGEMTGQVTPDDLLGHIFSTFCIGK